MVAGKFANASASGAVEGFGDPVFLGVVFDEEVDFGFVLADRGGKGILVDLGAEF